jgi:hypothetical protein
MERKRIRIFYIFAALLPKAKRCSVDIAQVAELVDALVSGTSIREGVQVRVLSWAPGEGVSNSLFLFKLTF